MSDVITEIMKNVGLLIYLVEINSDKLNEI